MKSLLCYYGIVALATTLFFWVFTIMGFFTPELKENAEKHGLTLRSALLLGVVLGLQWPKSMISVLIHIYRNQEKA